MFDRVKYGPFLVQLAATRKCNLACGYCSEYDKVSDPVPTETLKKSMRKLRELGTLFLEFTGGEPMLHPDINELIAYAKELGFWKVMMISNAYLFTEENIKGLNRAGLDDLQVSIDGVEPNDVTVKVLKPLRRKLKTLAKLAKFRVVLNSVMGAAPGEEVLEVIDFAKEQGFSPRVQIIHDDTGQFCLRDEDKALVPQIRERLGASFLQSGDYRTTLIETGESKFKCRGGSRYLYVDEFSVVHWCSQTRESWGKALEDYTVADLKEQFHTRKTCDTGCTIGCVRNQSRFDEWREQLV